MEEEDYDEAEMLGPVHNMQVANRLQFTL